MTVIDLLNPLRVIQVGLQDVGGINPAYVLINLANEWGLAIAQALRFPPLDCFDCTSNLLPARIQFLTA